jgi:hypothetical protein
MDLHMWIVGGDTIVHYALNQSVSLLGFWRGNHGTNCYALK